jgi:HK97 family phage major capsid protein
MSLILEAIKTALVEGKSTVNLKEASALTGSGSGIGGRVIYDDAFAALRMANPFRMAGVRVINTIGSDEAFVAKTGNATVIQTSTTNPWGYTIKNNVGNYNTAYWQISVKSINAQVPIRTAMLDDVNNLDESIVADIALEFAQQEALSMMLNNDLTNQSTPTPQTGGASGLRGLNFYSGNTTASFGTTGYAETNGRHTIVEVAAAGVALAYNDIPNLAAALPAQYWTDPSTAWMMHPTTIQQLRKLTAGSTGLPVFLEVGDDDGGSVLYIYGFPVIPNPYMEIAGAYKMPIYLAAWNQFMTIADSELMSIEQYEQTQPGFITLYAEKRLCSTVRNPFAGVRLACPAS